MDPTKVSGGKPGGRTAPKPEKTRKSAKPAKSFSAELAQAKRSEQPKKKPVKQESGPEVREYIRRGGVTVALVDSEKSGKRSVEITGTAAYTNKAGDLVDGGRARAGRVTKTAAVTVKVTDEMGTTKRSYKAGPGSGLRLELGNKTQEVTVRGDFTSPPDFETLRDPGNLRVDASRARGAGVSVFFYGQSGAELDFVGSPSRDVVYARSTGKVTVDAGAGPDYIEAGGGRGSVVKGGAGSDEIVAVRAETKYYSGLGPDTFHVRPDPLMDFDPSTDSSSGPFPKLDP